MAKGDKDVIHTKGLTSNQTPGGTYYPGGAGVLSVQGAFDAATVKLQWSFEPDSGGTWTDIGSGLTADGREAFTLEAGRYIRVNVAGGSTSIDLEIAVARTTEWRRGYLTTALDKQF